MKAFMLVVCVLTIASMVYTADVEDTPKFYKDLQTCTTELNLPEENGVDPLAIKCMLEKNSLIDEQGAMKKDEILKYFGSVSSERELSKIASCITQENRTNKSNDEKLLAAIHCSLLKLAILEKKF
ncbi:uncharacterized protein LOC114937695 isoform X2 [Nylanderia fulva]|uniref:uncharacterized protein LOC114937695 isoform X2 n=1 Tax=Nylanderia fulva TaxID=613905 RepID=UPI0010FB144F|nr:uncharacterized protein LOC114937695 isoform X2 [Nylanderia fulva]